MKWMLHWPGRAQLSLPLGMWVVALPSFWSWPGLVWIPSELQFITTLTSAGHKGALTAVHRLTDRKAEPFILYLIFHNFIWVCLWRNYGIIYSSTGCHQNNCNKCFPHRRPEKTFAVHFWMAQNIIRSTNISILTGSLNKQVKSHVKNHFMGYYIVSVILVSH